MSWQCKWLLLSSLSLLLSLQLSSLHSSFVPSFSLSLHSTSCVPLVIIVIIIIVAFTVNAIVLSPINGALQSPIHSPINGVLQLPIQSCIDGSFQWPIWPPINGAFQWPFQSPISWIPVFLWWSPPVSPHPLSHYWWNLPAFLWWMKQSWWHALHQKDAPLIHKTKNGGLKWNHSVWKNGCRCPFLCSGIVLERERSFYFWPFGIQEHNFCCC